MEMGVSPPRLAVEPRKPLVAVGAGTLAIVAADAKLLVDEEDVGGFADTLLDEEAGDRAVHVDDAAEAVLAGLDEAVELRLEKKGAGVVTAGDIKTTADVEIVNPDAVICTIDDPKTSITMDIVVESGRGYRTIEESGSKRAHSDMIALDAFFSPVKRVRYKVENTRVGQTTDLDKLLLTVDTDGSLSPTDAFEEAAAILINQYTALAGSTRVEAAPTLGSDAAEAGAELNTPIEDLNLTARTTNALINNDIRTINDLVTLSETDLRELKGFGSKALDEVKDKLAEMEF